MPKPMEKQIVYCGFDWKPEMKAKVINLCELAVGAIPDLSTCADILRHELDVYYPSNWVAIVLEVDMTDKNIS